MTFKKGHKYGIKPKGDKTLDGRIDIRTTKEVEAKIKAMPEWREKLRQLLEEWVKDGQNSDSP